MRHSRLIRRGGLAPDKYLTTDQVERLVRYLDVAAASGSNRAAVNRFVVLMLLYTGLRAEELMSLRIADTPAYHGKPIIDVREGKGRVGRTIDVPDFLIDEIKTFISTRRKSAKPGSALIASERGFRTLWLPRVMIVDGRRVVVKRQERSARMTYKPLLDRIKRIGVKAGVGCLRPHMLRHTYATMLYNIRQDILCVQDNLGHSDPKTTAIYARTMSQSRRQQANQMPVFSRLPQNRSEYQSRQSDMEHE